MTAECQTAALLMRLGQPVVGSVEVGSQ
jgi:hypothetical protein